MIGKNLLCADEAKVLLNETECEIAAKEMGVSFKMEITEHYPPGCYKISDVHFNRHFVGSKHNLSEPICKDLGKF